MGPGSCWKGNVLVSEELSFSVSQDNVRAITFYSYEFFLFVISFHFFYSLLMNIALSSLSETLPEHPTTCNELYCCLLSVRQAFTATILGDS